jgi:hypothetical protein
MRILCLLACIGSLFIISCGPGTVNPGDTVTIEIVSPENQKTYNNGENLPVVVNFTTEASVRNVRVRIYRMSDTTLVYNFQTDADTEKSYTHSGTYPISVGSETVPFQLLVAAWNTDPNPDTLRDGADFIVLP